MANSSLLQTIYFIYILVNFFKIQVTGCNFPQLSCQLSCTAIAKSEALVSILKGLLGSSNRSIGSKVTALRIFQNTCLCCSSYLNLVSLQVKLYRGFAIALKPAINIQQKLTKLIKAYTSITLVSRGQFQTTSTFVGSIYIFPSVILQPRNTVFQIQNLLLSWLTESQCAQRALSTSLTCFLCSLSVLEQMRILSR